MSAQTDSNVLIKDSVFLNDFFDELLGAYLPCGINTLVGLNMH